MNSWANSQAPGARQAEQAQEKQRWAFSANSCCAVRLSSGISWFLLPLCPLLFLLLVRVCLLLLLWFEARELNRATHALTGPEAISKLVGSQSKQSPFLEVEVAVVFLGCLLR